MLSSLDYVIITVIMLFSLLLCILMQVPASDFAGYVRVIIHELYAPLVAAVDGRLTGPGTLGTVMLCECLPKFTTGEFTSARPSA